jgi:arylsulfatase A-like enzyme
LVQQVGIASNKTQLPKDADTDDGHWRADPKLWGLDEGSYDQREAIIAPPTSHMSWRFSLPRKSTFQVAVAAFAGDGEVEFEIAVVAAGKRQVLLRKKVAKSRRWEDLSVDLVAFGGEVTLELTTAGRDGTLGAWGSPVVTSPGASTLPYNVLFFVVDAMRSDALASVHDPEYDARLAAAKLPPLDAWLPPMPEVAPNLDRLASEGTTFANARTAAMWTRPATLAMLTGMRAGRLGLPILELEPRPSDVRAFYERNPPLWPLLMREHGAATRAVINNMYLCGYVGVGVDTGFESMTDHRYQVKDTEKITADTIGWLESHREDRFALFVNYVSPHAPYVPDPSDLEPIDHASPRPGNKQVRRYLAEIRKDDAAIGRVLERVNQLGLSSKTLVVVTADHGETLSEAHDWVAVDVAKGVHSGRFTHLSTMWEEAARVPLIFTLPGVISAKQRVTEQVQTTDILPTALDILGVDIPAGIDGMSLKPLLTGGSQRGRAAVIEGRGATSIIDGRWHYVQRSPIARRLQLHDVQVEKAVELYDLINDPGERQDVSSSNPDVLEQLKRGLAIRLTPPTKADKHAEVSKATVHLQISAGTVSGNLAGSIVLTGGQLSVASKNPAVSIDVKSPTTARVQTKLTPGALVDLDLTIEPASAVVDWDWQLAGNPWPQTAYYVGALGLARDLSKGIPASGSEIMVAAQPPYVVSTREQGIFVTRDSSNGAESTISQAAQAEAQQAMQAWGYVRRNGTAPK